jgi:glycosyltransferase involved in cell wall biosynthesis
MKWTFWLNMTSPHMAPFLRALASMPDHSVTIVAERAISEERVSLGWRLPDCGAATVIHSPGDQAIEELIRKARDPDSVHLFGGWRDVPLNRRVLPHVAKTEATVGLMSEAADGNGLKGSVRRAVYWMEQLWLAPRLDLILTMGTLGMRWFEAVGFEPSRIFPFGYGTERTLQPCSISNRKLDGFRILYLGRTIPEKDGPTMIRGFASLDLPHCHLDIVGDGRCLANWKQEAAKSAAHDRIHFKPPVPQDRVAELYAQADLLLLASKYDGWGAVVNEALMCGVPVVCSDHCGAADLLRDAWRGSVFKAGSIQDLRAALSHWIVQGKRTAQQGGERSARIQRWSRCLEGDRIAAYLIKVVDFVQRRPASRAHRQSDYPRPAPPWE